MTNRFVSGFGAKGKGEDTQTVVPNFSILQLKNFLHRFTNELAYRATEQSRPRRDEVEE